MLRSIPDFRMEVMSDEVAEEHANELEVEIPEEQDDVWRSKLRDWYLLRRSPRGQLVRITHNKGRNRGDMAKCSADDDSVRSQLREHGIPATEMGNSTHECLIQLVWIERHKERTKLLARFKKPATAGVLASFNKPRDQASSI